MTGKVEEWEAWDTAWSQDTVDGNWVSHEGRFNDPARLAVVDVCRHTGSASLLDLGCGGAIMAAYLDQIAPDVRYTGVDISEKMLVAARRINPSAELRHADIVTFDGPDRGWGVVLLRGVLEHHPLSKGEQLLESSARLAAKAVVVNFYMRPRVEAEPPIIEGRSGPFYENWWSEPWVREKMRALGFEAGEPLVHGRDYLLDFRRTAP